MSGATEAIVIGNITLDESFSLAALPRPGETLLATDCACDLGGKGANQAVLLARAGVTTRLVARLGEDGPAALLRAMLARERLDASGLIATGAATDRSMIFVADDGENCIVTTARCARAMTEQDVTAALTGAGGALLVMQGNLQAPVTGAALRTARARGMICVFNPAPADPGFAALWPFVDLAVLNRTEAHALAGSDDAVDAAARIRAAGAARAVVTLGGDGAVMADADGEYRVAAEPVQVRDTTGAGDTFTAVLAAALFARRMEARAALRAAVRAAAITVGRPGTLAAFPSAGELEAILSA